MEDSLDDGPERAGKRAHPIRRCLATGERKPQSEMIRFVVGPDAQVVPDLKAVLPGRGMWLSARAECIKTACKRSLFAKAARARVIAPDDLAERIEALLVQRCLNWLAQANRAGEAVAGFEKVRSALKAARAGVVLAASDGAADGRQKIGALAGDLLVVDLLTAEELGGVFGRDHRVHVLITPGGLADGFASDAARLKGFRNSGPSEEQG